jgi:hypothetical protein
MSKNNPQSGDLVLHIPDKQIGILVEEQESSTDFWRVICEGSECVWYKYNLRPLDDDTRTHEEHLV